MPVNKIEDARYENGSPLQLLIFLTVGCTTFLCLMAADFLEWPVIESILIGASILTGVRAVKKILVNMSVSEHGVGTLFGENISIRQHIKKFVGVYFSMLMLSLFFYGVGVAFHNTYHFFD